MVSILFRATLFSLFKFQMFFPHLFSYIFHGVLNSSTFIKVDIIFILLI